MITVLDTRYFVHIPEHSCYNNNFYRNIHTGQILFEQADDDHGAEFWWSTEEDMVNHSHKNDIYIGFAWMEDFDIPTQIARERGTADEYVYEFDSEF